jgi:hypothetical protein
MGLFFNGIIGKLGNKERRYLHYSCGLADLMQVFGVEVTVISYIFGVFAHCLCGGGTAPAGGV